MSARCGARRHAGSGARAFSGFLTRGLGVVACLISVVLTACGGDGGGEGAGNPMDPGPELKPVVLQVAGVEPAIEEHLRSAYEEVARGLAAEPVDRSQLAELAGAYGELGLAAQVYDLPELALPAYDNAATLAQRAEEPREAGAWLDYRGEVLRGQGRFAEAVEVYRRAAELLPGDGPVRIRLGLAALAAGSPREAQKTFEEILALAAAGPSSSTTSWEAAASFGLGRSLLDQGAAEEAVAAFEASLALEPQADRVRYFLASAYRALQEMDSAREQLESSGRREPIFADPRMARLVSVARSPSTFRQRGGWALKDGQLTAAVEAYRRAVELDGDNLEGRQGLSSALRRAGDLEGAQEQLVAALELAPGDVPTTRELASVLRELGRPAEAARVLTNLPESALGSEDAGFLLELGQAWEAAGDSQRSERAYEEARGQAQQEENPRIAFESRVGALRSRADEESMKALGELSNQELRSADAALYGASPLLATRSLARLQAALGEEEEAIGRYRRALERFPQRLDLRFELAGQLGQAGRFQESAAAYRKVIEGDANSLPARLGEITALTLAGRDQVAAERLEEGLRAFPSSMPLRLARVRLLALSSSPAVKNTVAAVREAEEIFSSAPSAEAGQLLALCLAAAGRFEEAAGLQSQLVQQLESSALAQRPEGQALLRQLRSDLAAYAEGRLPG
ncbi:MAG: tetratricopeptide repeat protein [Acidobacteriota bacterium]